MNEPDKPTSAEYKTIIERCFTAFNAKDRETIEGLFSSLFTFTSPYDDAIDRATYFERCWPNSDRLRQHIIEGIFVEGIFHPQGYRDINLVTWWILKHKNIVLLGSSPRSPAFTVNWDVTSV
jgi:hypothetical protein